MSSLRLRLVTIVLFAAAFGLFAESAFATHFRYAYMFWERDLTYVPTTPGFVRVKVTVLAGGRWSYNAWRSATPPTGFTPVPRCTSAATCCVGGLVQNPVAATSAMSCPNVGSLIEFSGGLSAATAGVAFSMPAGGTVKVNKIIPNQIASQVTTLNLPTGGLPLQYVPVHAVVKQVIPSEDTMYAQFDFWVEFDGSKILNLKWEDNARLSNLQNSNGGANWKLLSTINLTGANAGLTRSPITQSPAIITVFANQTNVITLPSQGFDNLSVRWRLATANSNATLSESGLVIGQPSSPATFSFNGATGTITMTSPAGLFYGTQFIMEAYDPANPSVVKTSVPLDLMFQSVPASTNTVTQVTGDGNSTYTATVPQPFSFTVRSTAFPVTTANEVRINSGVLPAGATFTHPACNAGSTCVGTFNWTPTVNSTGQLVCFTSTVVSPVNALLATSSPLCVTINLNPLETTLVADAASGAAGGGPLTLRARLTRSLDSGAISGRPVKFTFEGDTNNPPWVATTNGLGTDTVLTDTNGYATLVVTSTRAVPTPAPYRATFNAIAGEFLSSSSGVNLLSTRQATTSLNAPAGGTNPFPSVDHPLAISAVLNRHLTPPDGGVFGVGATLDFTLTAPGGATSQLSAGPTNVAGVATATFPAPAVIGTYTATASFAGNDALFGGVTSPVGSLTVRQRTQVTMSAGVGYQNGPTQVTALLVATPSNTPLASRSVTFTTTGATVNSQTVSTDGSGVATASFTWSTTGAKSVTATFTPNNAAELNRDGLEANDASSANTTVQAAVSTVTTLGAFTGTSGQATTLTAALKTSANAPVSGATVTFSQVGGGTLGSGVTLADGTVSVAFTPGAAVSGTYRADFAGMPGFAPSFATNTFTISKANTTLAALTVNANDLVGNSLVVSTTLSRTSAPAGAISGAQVAFTLTQPGGSTQVQNGTTDGNGLVSVTFPQLTIRGAHTVQAAYAGTTALNASSRSANVAVYQRTQLTFNGANGVATDPTSISAALRALPGNVLISSAVVNFDFNGVVASGDAQTDGSGVATVVRNFSTPGTFVATASFNDLAGYYVDVNGQPLPSTATSLATISSITTALSAVTSPATGTVGQSVSVSTTLSRTTLPSGPLSGQLVNFAITGPSGTTNASATTNGSGIATANFTPMERGNYQVTATFAGDSALTASTTAASTTAVSHPTTMTLSPITGFAGRNLTLTATLLSNPGGWGVSAQTVVFTFTGAGAPAQVSAVTDGDGIATVSPLFAVPGTFTATATFSSAAFFGGSSASAAATATNTAPTIINLPDVSAPATSAAGRVVNFTSTGNDAEDGALAPVCSATSGTFPIGTTTVTCTVTDIVGVSASDSFTITITNNAPTISDLPDINATATSAAGRVVSFTSTGTDTEDGALTPVCTPATGSTFAIGATSVTCTVTDVAGASASDSFTVTITNSAPTIIDLPNLNGEATSAAGRDFTFTSTANDAEEGSLAPVCSASSGTFAIGTTTVTCTVTDVAGASASDSFTVTVVDTTAPVLTLPTIAPAFATSGAGRQVNYTATALDIVDGATTVTCSPVSGSTFPIATTTVNCTTTDARSNTSTGSFDVSITNNAPTIVDLPNLNGEATSSAGRAFTFASTANDTEEGVLPTTCTSSSGTFAIGTTTVTCTVTDVTGASASDSFTITVVDTTAPALTLPTIAPAFATSAAGRVVTYTTSALDIVDGSTAVTCSPVSGSTFPIATTTVNCTTTDARGNTSTGSFDVSITNNAPTIVDLPNLAGEATSAAGRDFTFTSTANDAEEGSLAPVCSASSGTFPIGVTEVTCTVTDVTGASASDTFIVTVVDTTAPALTLPAVAPAFAESAAGRAIGYTATALDLVDGIIAPLCTPASWSVFPIGDTTVTCSATDSVGNTAHGSFVISVTNNAPTFTAPNDITLAATSAAGRTVAFTAAGSDLEQGSIDAVCVPASGSTFALGTTTVNCTVTDVATASASDSFTVTITNSAPTISDLTDITVAATSGAGAVVSFTSTANDAEQGALTPTCSAASGTFPIGSTTVNCSVADFFGLTASDSFTITVTNAAPTIADLGNLSGEATGAAGRAFSFTSTGNDAEQGALTPVCSAASGTFPIGTTTVTCTVTDFAGLTASDSFTITVADTTAPIVTVESKSFEQTSLAGATGVFASSATDIVDGTMTPVCTPASGATFARGINNVTCTVTDAHGNSGTASGSITVVDTIKPVVTYTGNAGTYTADQIVNITCAATDSGSGVASTTCANVTGPAHTFLVGVNTRTASATDNAGNTNSASISFTVTVPPAAVGNVITNFVDNPTEAAKMNATLNQATSAPNANARAAHLNKLVKDIEKEIGKSLTAAEAATLIALLQNLY